MIARSLVNVDTKEESSGGRCGHEVPGGDARPDFVTETEGGLHIVDVWESKEAFEKFADEQIGPYSREVGITEQPEISFRDVHNYLTS